MLGPRASVALSCRLSTGTLNNSHRRRGGGLSIANLHIKTLAGFSCSRADDRGPPREHITQPPSRERSSRSRILFRAVAPTRGCNPLLRAVVECSTFGVPGTNWLATLLLPDGNTRIFPAPSLCMLWSY